MSCAEIIVVWVNNCCYIAYKHNTNCELLQIIPLAISQGFCYYRIIYFKLKEPGNLPGFIMPRIALTDGSGRWFSTETAELFTEATYWDGHNTISKATGSQWEHEALYRTAGGRFILNRWSDYQGTVATYKEIDNAAAAKWFSINEHEPHQQCEQEFKDLEII